MSAWELTGIAKEYRTGGWLRPARARVAVESATLLVEKGERVGLIGESGSGKTTLARIGLGLVPADAGAIRLFDEDTAGWRPRRWRQARRHAQLLFQDPRAMLNPAMPIGVLLYESARLHGAEEPRAAAAQALGDVGLDGRYDAFPSELSGGERRRAGIARLLVARPRLVVADEPTTGLDAALKASLLELLLAHLGADCAVVLISHDLPLIAWACDRVCVMHAGRIVDRFPAAALSHRDDERHPHTLALLAAADLGGQA